METTGEWLLLIFGVLLLLAVIGWTIWGALFLFAMAAEQGFIGLAIYVLCWVFMFIPMLVICTITGAVMWFRQVYS